MKDYVKELNKLIESAILEAPLLSRYSRSAVLDEHNVMAAATDGKKIYFGKKFFDFCQDYPDRLFVVFHEITHILMRHTLYKPANKALHKKFNIAADKAVNSWLLYNATAKNIRYANSLLISDKLHKSLILPENGEEWGRAWTYYWDRIEDGDPSLGRDDGVGSMAPSDHGDPMGNDDDDTENFKRSMLDDVLAEEGDDIGKRFNSLVAKSVAGRGLLPEYIIKEIDDILGRFDWRKTLRRYLSEACMGAGDILRRFDANRIARYKAVANSPIIRRMYKETTKILVVVDVSGSMSGIIDVVVGEVKKLVKLFTKNVDVMTWDVEKKDMWKRGTFDGKVRGFGGTDMAEAIRSVSFKDYNVVVLITDGETPWPVVTPVIRKKLLVVLTYNGFACEVPEGIKYVIYNVSET